MNHYLLINGPGLGHLGAREPEIYGHRSLSEIQSLTQEVLSQRGFGDVALRWFQSNHEGEIVSRIHQACQEDIDGLVINPGAYTHTSVAILDALRMCSFPVAEAHLSNTARRESFRQDRITSQGACYIVEGAREMSYALGVMSLVLGRGGL